MKKNLTKRLWKQLTPAQKEEFSKQLIKCGYKTQKNWKMLEFQLDEDGGCYGWIDKYLLADLFPDGVTHQL